jgi:hypothetical protein
MLSATGAANHAKVLASPGRRVPSGPRGLWGALATAAAPRVGARALPLSDVSALGVTARSMFAYDPALAISLGEELDPSVLLG